MAGPMEHRRLKILFLLQPGNVSREIFRDCIRGFEAAGHACLVAELAPLMERAQAEPGRRPQLAQQATAQIAGAIGAQRIDLSVAMWSNALSLLSHSRSSERAIPCFEAMTPPSPHLMIWLDAPHWAQGGTVPRVLPSGLFKSPWLFSVVNNESTAEEMRKVLGFAHARGLPYGVCEKTFRPAPARPMKDREFDLAFALGPGDEPPSDIMREELERERPDEQRIRLDVSAGVRPGLKELAGRGPGGLRDAMATLLERLLDEQLADPHRGPLARLADLTQREPGLREAGEALVGEPGLFIDATTAVRRVEWWRRAFTFAFLSRRLTCVLMGAPNLEGWGCPAHAVGHVPHEEQAATYSRARIGLSIVRWQDDVGLNIKPFEVTASGCVGLVGRRAGLSALWTPDEEIVAFDDAGDALARARALLAQPERLEAIGAAGRARTLRDHTWRTRVGEITGEIGRLTGRW